MDGIILALGSINADFQMRLDRPLESATTLLAHDLQRLGGGKAANVAYLARRLGHGARLFGRVGRDDLAEQALSPLRAAGVELADVSHTAASPTGVAMVVIPPSGKKHIVVATNANDAWDDWAVVALCRHIEEAPAASVLAVNCEVPAAVVKAAVACAKGRGLRVVLDPSFPERVDAELLAKVDAVTPNESEARSLKAVSGASGDTPLDLARGLLDRGPGLVCIKLDDGGCLLAQAQGHLHIPAPKVDVVDTTGAGDAFTGALAVALLEGQDAEAAARFAVVVSTLAVTAYGAQPSYPTRDAVGAFLRQTPARAAKP